MKNVLSDREHKSGVRRHGKRRMLNMVKDPRQGRIQERIRERERTVKAVKEVLANQTKMTIPQMETEKTGELLSH